MLEVHHSRPSRKKAATTSDARRWIWPLPKIDGQRPSIVGAEIDPRRPHIGYAIAKRLPRFIPVFAPRDGVIAFAGKVTIECEGKTFDRHQLWLDHGGGWSTRYGNLEHMFATPTDRYAHGRKARVRAGDVLGYASASPLELWFELWRTDEHGIGPVEVTEYLPTWIALPWSKDPDNQAAA